MMNSSEKKIYWIDLNRFDMKMDKSTYIEIGDILSKNGFNAYLLTGFRNKKYFPNKRKIKIIYFASMHLSGWFRYILMLNIFLWLLPRIRKEDIIFVQPGALPLACLLKWLRKCKVHLDVRTIPVEVHGFRGRVDWWLFWHMPIKWCVRFADGYSFITNPLRETIEKEFGLHFKHYVIWTSGVNALHFSRSRDTKEKRPLLGILFYSGVITQNRGLDTVFYALKILKEKYYKQLKFWLVGDGSYRKKLERLAQELRIDAMVKFYGYVPYEEMPRILQKADCFICPLPDFPEWRVSSPLKLFEYMMFARPIILTPLEAHKQIVQGQSFIIWSQGYEPAHLAKAIKIAITHYSYFLQEAQYAPNFAKMNYEWSIQGQKLVDYLKGMLF